MTLSHEDRLNNVVEHVAMLTEILSRQAPPEAQQRIYRARAIIDDDFIVVTLLQNLPSFVPTAGQPDVKIMLFVDRPYTTTATGGTPIMMMSLVGQYSLDEIVAFLALDKVEPASLTWKDETKYSSLVVVGDILRKLR
jgi:hypothetical protein